MSNLRKYTGSMFDNHSVGASMRKILAFITGVVFAGYLHFAFVDPSNAFEFLVADLACALLCLGIITMEQVIKFKNSGDDNTPVDQPVTTDTTTADPNPAQN